jgi:hypothetical protein
MSGRQSSGTHASFAAAHASADEAGPGIRTAAQRAPIWVIAVMGHLALGAVLGTIYIRSETGEPVERTRIASIAERPPDRVKLDDTAPMPLPPIDGLPRIGDEDPLGFLGSVDGAGELVGRTAPHGTARDLVGGASDAGTEVDGGAPVDHGLGAAGPIGNASGSRPGPGARGRPSRINTRLTRSQPFLAKVEPPLTGGLRWLREHQSEDGMWDCDGFALRCDPKHGPACTGAGGDSFDVGVTGLALLAFLGAGCDGNGQTPNDEAVRKGLKWLRSVQDAEGCFGSRADTRFTYSHACATLAMCEAAAFNRGYAWRKSAQAAVQFIEATRNPGKGWRYGVRPGESDVSVTGWMLLALKAAKDASLAVDERTIRDGLAFLDALTDPVSGRTGYLRHGELAVRPEGYVNRWPAEESESLTAVAICSRIFLGRDEGDALTKAGADLLARKLPVWDETRGSIDMYYWYYGTLAMHQLGGASWERWNKSIESAIVENQIKTGCAEGSWDPKDPWGVEGGRVYATALMTLCLEVYWRYPLVFGARR